MAAVMHSMAEGELGGCELAQITFSSVHFLVSGANPSQSITKRLQTELMNMMMDAPPGTSAFPDCDNMLNWTATVRGVAGTVYADLEYKLSLQFPSDYPFSAPIVKFKTPCFHPNVDEFGNICLDILKEKWSACYNVSTVLLSIQSLLGTPRLSLIALDLL